MPGFAAGRNRWPTRPLLPLLDSWWCRSRKSCHLRRGAGRSGNRGHDQVGSDLDRRTRLGVVGLDRFGQLACCHPPARRCNRVPVAALAGTVNVVVVNGRYSRREDAEQSGCRSPGLTRRHSYSSTNRSASSTRRPSRRLGSWWSLTTLIVCPAAAASGSSERRNDQVRTHVDDAARLLGCWSRCPR